MERKNENIGYSDECSNEDFLGGDKYYDGLTSFITTCSTPMTISIQGDWGTGKTTALNLIEKKIEQKGKSKYNIMWFRTWQYSKFGMEENMALSLMINLYSKLVKIAEDKKIKFKDKGSPFLFAKNIADIASSAIESVAGGKIAERTSAAFNALLGIDHIKNVAEQLEELKTNIQECINKTINDDERLIIFIDDLDRLEPAVSVELLENIKIFLDCTKCVFVIAVDSQVVFQGVKHKYGNDFAEDKAKKFFDKIIQVPFNLPVIQYDIKLYISQFVSASDTIDNYCSLVGKILNNNPRSIKRAFNLLELYKQIMNDLINNQTDELYLFSIILLQIKDENAYLQLVKAARDSNKVVSDLLTNDKEYEYFLEALGLKVNESTVNENDTDVVCVENESLTRFVELIASTSQISVANRQDVSNEYAGFDAMSEVIKGIISKVSKEFRKVQLNNNIINFLDSSDVKRCSFRIKEKALNVVVYCAQNETLNLPSNEKLIDGAKKRLSSINQETEIGYYQSHDYITFVDVHKCKDIELVNEILSFYKLCDV